MRLVLILMLVGVSAMAQTGPRRTSGSGVVVVGSLGSCASPNLGQLNYVSTSDRLYVCDGAEWARVLTDRDINGDMDVPVRGIIAQAASTEYGFRCLHDGCRVDFGGSTNDYAYASNGTIIFNSTRHGDITVETIGSVQGYINIFSPRVFPGSSLSTCTAGTEGRLGALTGSSLSSQTRMCACVSDGGGTPAFSWVNLGCPNTPGTTTTCPACP